MPEPEPAPAAIPASAPALPPALPPSPLERLDDFPDRLSPMLVKELRQGLRTNTFVILFLVLQGILALVLLTAGPIAASDESSSGAAGSIVSKVVFCIYALGILLVQPLRGISAVATEIKQNTIDLMVLTRLSAWRIVWGKWTAIVSQSALILLAILPYVILRYFFGGMQLFAEMALMIYIFILSGAFTAFTVGISAVGSVLIRGLLVVVGSATLMVYIPFYFTPDLDSYIAALSFTTRDSIGALGVLALAAYGGYFFLELGATAIAPASENRATQKRLIGLAMVVICFLTIRTIDLELAITATLLVSALVSIDLFSEKANFPSVVCKPFLRWGVLGRLLGRFLYPGWATGTLFFMILAIVVTGLVAQSAPAGSDGMRAFTVTGVGFGVMVFPAAMLQLFARRSEQRFTLYVTLMLMSVLLTFILGLLFSGMTNKSTLWIFAPIPMVQFPIIDELWAMPEERQGLFWIAWGTMIAYLFIVAAGAIPRLLGLARLEREALTAAREEFERSEHAGQPHP